MYRCLFQTPKGILCYFSESGHSRLKMSSLFKMAHISKRVIRPLNICQRNISTSKKNQEVCVTSAEITDQEQVIFSNYNNTKSFSCHYT